MPVVVMVRSDFPSVILILVGHCNCLSNENQILSLSFRYFTCEVFLSMLYHSVPLYSANVKLLSVSRYCSSNNKKTALNHLGFFFLRKPSLDASDLINFKPIPMPPV